jgi:hypothetical protein
MSKKIIAGVATSIAALSTATIVPIATEAISEEKNRGKKLTGNAKVMSNIEASGGYK